MIYDALPLTSGQCLMPDRDNFRGEIMVRINSPLIQKIFLWTVGYRNLLYSISLKYKRVDLYQHQVGKSPVYPAIFKRQQQKKTRQNAHQGDQHEA
ncbi:MAG: hypothetical protein ABW152_02740 [Candidatus Thiodiazotropha endolucinida]